MSTLTSNTVNGHASANNNFDILVVGGGISGINTSYRLSTLLPSSSFAVLESRHEIGGTWSQFKYPGVRSDSDLHTFGFPFNPWKSSNTIATGESIMTYMKETVQKFDLEKYFRFGQKVKSANWLDEEQKWRLEVDVTQNGGETRHVVYWTKWLILGTGYYSYEKPMETRIPGLKDFQGTVAHPQFWPEDIEYKGKKVVVIGSGATAITILPAMVDQGVELVTQLQRSPTYVMSVPQAKPEDAGWLQKLMPQWVISRWLRFVNVLLPILFYYFCIYFPIRATNLLRSEAKALLPADFSMDPNLKPGYKPWAQRLCYCPDGDYFKCFHSGRAQIVTDTIKTVTKTGIELDSGKKLDADIIVTATGLRLQLFGGINVTVNGKPVEIPNQHLWRFSMITGIPNFGNIIGYWNHSWTLGSDLCVRLFIRIIKRMEEQGYTYVVPELTEKDKPKKDVIASPLSSTYIKNGLDSLPKCKESGPFKVRPNYFLDKWYVETCSLKDGLKWEKVST